MKRAPEMAGSPFGRLPVGGGLARYLSRIAAPSGECRADGGDYFFRRGLAGAAQASGISRTTQEGASVRDAGGRICRKGVGHGGDRNVGDYRYPPSEFCGKFI